MIWLRNLHYIIIKSISVNLLPNIVSSLTCIKIVLSFSWCSWHVFFWTKTVWIRMEEREHLRVLSNQNCSLRCLNLAWVAGDIPFMPGGVRRKGVGRTLQEKCYFIYLFTIWSFIHSFIHWVHQSFIITSLHTKNIKLHILMCSSRHKNTQAETIIIKLWKIL